jgi:DNA-binding NarL/FixJ family response regulator
VVLMDLHMPGVDGVEATSRIRRLVPDTAVLVLTMIKDDEWVFAAMRAGARGYLLKGATQEVIARAIQTVADGGASFGPEVAARVLGLLTDPRIQDVPFPELTDRERGAGPDRRRLIQRGDRRPAAHLGEDGEQPHLQHLR